MSIRHIQNLVIQSLEYKLVEYYAVRKFTNTYLQVYTYSFLSERSGTMPSHFNFYFYKQDTNYSDN